MKPEIINTQRKIKLELQTFQDFAGSVSEQVAETRKKAFVIAFVSDWKMRKLNRMFRGNRSTTDVLSFPFEAADFENDFDNLGEIVISVEQAGRQAEENGLSLEVEIKQLILHGVLHLCGYDHDTDDGEMNARELELRAILRI